MDEREHERFVVDRQIKCLVDDRCHEVFLYDLCSGGCMIEALRVPICIGTKLELHLNRFIVVSGTIVWKRGASAGVRFSQILHEAAVRHLGFTPQGLAFEALAPRDRFGRLLPPLPQY
ncbi:PilZ domain-containing protein [Novosphingobium sp. PY1]|uniref:PilZ domain-containing protein n=1 Tax=Novosphingobium sp. PY1 TaxID=1882221 RepID=UPI001A8EB6D1|nr:PilZ domain-containing protein [Novosphingobium sp. PY1]